MCLSQRVESAVRNYPRARYVIILACVSVLLTSLAICEPFITESTLTGCPRGIHPYRSIDVCSSAIDNDRAICDQLPCVLCCDVGQPADRPESSIVTTVMFAAGVILGVLSVTIISIILLVMLRSNNNKQEDGIAYEAVATTTAAAVIAHEIV